MTHHDSDFNDFQQMASRRLPRDLNQRFKNLALQLAELELCKKVGEHLEPEEQERLRDVEQEIRELMSMHPEFEIQMRDMLLNARMTAKRVYEEKPENWRDVMWRLRHPEFREKRSRPGGRVSHFRGPNAYEGIRSTGDPEADWARKTREQCKRRSRSAAVDRAV